MKTMRIITVIIFAAVLILPLALFNFTPEAMSEIDNRMLAGNPFEVEYEADEEVDRTGDIENYINDRIGLRDEMILSYTVLNDKLFGKMVHPTYSYGKDGYVFGAGVSTEQNIREFHVDYADMVAEIQKYCEDRGVPFLFVFNPAKAAVYTDKVSGGINYSRGWVDQFLGELDARGINYLDNTVTLKELRAEGIESFNRKYDANHWNDLGAFYGTQKMLERLNELDPAVHVNELSEFTVGAEHEETLPVSQFPINEEVPKLESSAEYVRLQEQYAGELERHPSHQSFGYYVNQSRKDEGSPRVLVFQGSYMNGKGEKYFINALGEYIHVHDYENVMNFPYYFNIFRPDCVVLEVGEYTVSEKYFDAEKLKTVQFNPPLEKTEHREVKISPEALTVEKGEALTKIFWATEETYECVWLQAENVYDMAAAEGGYTATVLAEEDLSDMKLFCR